MESIDRRTRWESNAEGAGSAEPLDAATWFAEQLPLLHVGLAARGLEHLGLPPLAIDVDGLTYTLRAHEGALVARPGIADGAVVLGLDAAQFADFVHERRSMVAFWTGRDARMDGPDNTFLAWDCVWRALIDGHPVHEPGELSIDVNLSRSFAPDDDPAEIAHFLREAGFLHLKRWLAPEDMATIAEDMDRAADSYAEGDGRSWWAQTADGTHRLVRLQHFHEHSPTTEAILDGPTWDRLRTILGGGVDELQHRASDTNRVEALVKPLGVVKGISDVPWHRDCAFGRHTYGCASTTVGVSVTAGGEGTGQLRVVAGSHRANVPSSGGLLFQDLPVVPLPTDVGDLTVHLSCTLHEAMPPITGERKVLYSGFSLRMPEGSVGRKSAQLAELRERAHLLRDQPPSPVAAGSRGRTGT